MVSADGHYTWFRTLLMMLGVSAEPVKISYLCRECWKVFDQTTDPADLRRAC
jgi:hypothetical protein